MRATINSAHIDGAKASLTRTLNNLGKKSKVIKVLPFWHVVGRS
jgi:DNA gyrase subunit B